MSQNHMLGVRGGISIKTESSRSPEFKEARDRLVTSVNSWLTGLAAKRDANEPLADGTTIVDKPRITRTLLGKTAVGTSAMAEDTMPGISLNGDGTETPLVLQAFRPDESGEGGDVIEVTGSKKAAGQLVDDGYSAGRSEIITEFKMRDVQRDGSENYFGYEIEGDGSMYRKFVSPQGVHTKLPVSTAEDVGLAEAAFQLIQSKFEGKFISA